MPGAREDLQWIIIDDFTPGIVNPRLGAAQPAPHLVYFGYGAHKTPLGAAQANGTYGCVASPSGALVPAPRLDYMGMPPRVSATGSYPAGENRDVVLATHIVSPVHDYSGPNIGIRRGMPDAIFCVFGTFIDPAGGTAYRQRITSRMYQPYLNSANYPSLGDVPNDITPWGPVDVNLGADGLAWHAPFLHSRADICNTVGVQSNLPVPQVAFAIAWSNAVNGSSSWKTYVFPSQSANNTNVAVLTASQLQKNWLVTAHQGRVVGAGLAHNFITQDGDYLGSVGEVWGPQDLSYYPVRGMQLGAITQLTRPAEDNPNGITVLASVNANELVVIKGRGGGLILTGDLTNPTIKRMPGLASTGDVFCSPVSAPPGLFYAGREGVYVWPGQDVSTRISQQLDGAFWIPNEGAINRSGLSGQMEYIEPWILCPNNYMFDTRFNSWWLLHDNVADRQYFSYHASANGGFWAITNYLGGINGFLHHYDVTKGTDWFQWTSQPMTPIPGHMVEVRDCLLMVEGKGNVQINIIPSRLAEGGGPFDATFEDYVDVNTTSPTVIRFNVNLTTEAIQIVIQSVGFNNGTLNSSPSPIIHGIRLGYAPTTRHPSVSAFGP